MWMSRRRVVLSEVEESKSGHMMAADDAKTLARTSTLAYPFIERFPDGHMATPAEPANP